MEIDILLAGSTGLVGGEVLKKSSEAGFNTHTIVRTLSETPSPDESLIDFNEIKNLPKAKNIVICIGHPLSSYQLVLMNENTKKTFYKVDCEYVIDLAKKAFLQGAESIAIISAVGASPRSLNFYLKTKGEMEEEIKSIGFKKVIFARPGHLLGKRAHSRKDFGSLVLELFDRIFGVFMLGPVKKFRNIEAAEVADKVLESLNNKRPFGVYVIEHKEIIEI